MKQSLLSRLAEQPHALNHLLFGLTEDQIQQRPQSDKWSIFENLAHLGRYQEVFLDRIQQIISNVTPRFDRYVADNDSDFAEWTRLSFQTLTERMQHERAALNAFLSILREEQLVSVGLHPAFGPMTVEGWAEFFLLHEAHHFFTILKIGGTLRTEDQPMGW
ncbi:DinB family protein [Spirosoma sp. BT702]|uniref:DinB family protein n=1 Tax=Spirosoma profusum TaxID=2771354 RepID=A0A926Y010_9BACT|nr:DinB family protein [Spirosoma profusum]MBD2704134.1 DinB family protein [Spirosoma profusum]